MSKQEAYDLFRHAMLDGKADVLRSITTADFRAQIPGGRVVDIDGFIDEVLTWRELLPKLGEFGRQVGFADEPDTALIVGRYEYMVPYGKRRIRLTVLEIVEVRKGLIADAVIIFDHYGTTAQRIASHAPVPKTRRSKRHA